MLLNAVWLCDIVQIHVCSTDPSAEPHIPTTACLKDALPGKVGWFRLGMHRSERSSEDSSQRKGHQCSSVAKLSRLESGFHNMVAVRLGNFFVCLLVSSFIIIITIFEIRYRAQNSLKLEM